MHIIKLQRSKTQKHSRLFALTTSEFLRAVPLQIPFELCEARVEEIGMGYNLPFSFCCDNNFFHQSRHQRMEAPSAYSAPPGARGVSQRTWHTMSHVTLRADIQIQNKISGICYCSGKIVRTKYIDYLTQSGSKPPQRKFPVSVTKYMKACEEIYPIISLNFWWSNILIALRGSSATIFSDIWGSWREEGWQRKMLKIWNFHEIWIKIGSQIGS